MKWFWITQRMSTPARLKSALKGLVAALDQLEAACERRLKADAERNDIEEEFAVLQDDRARLAVELDGAVARSQSLELANHEVARRLAKARQTIKAMM
jgi:chromosome segregation ATPase